MANFSTNQKYLDLYGLQLFWSKVKAYISSQKTNVVANHAKDDESVDKVWVGVTAGGDGLTYTIDDTAINSKFDAIDQELSEIKASAGVTKVTVEDASNDKTNYVTLKSNNDAGTGDITLTLDDTALENKISTLESTLEGADTAETAARKAADALLAGEGWNADSGTWSAAPDYATIATLSQKLKAAETSISALSNAVQFLGVSSTAITNGGTEKPTIDDSAVNSLDAGDVVFYGNKEFIWDGAKWVELGDTTLESHRLGVLEAWIGNGGTTGSYITNSDINAMFVDGWSLPTAPTGRQ